MTELDFNRLAAPPFDLGPGIRRGERMDWSYRPTGRAEEIWLRSRQVARS